MPGLQLQDPAREEPRPALRGGGAPGAPGPGPGGGGGQPQQRPFPQVRVRVLTAAPGLGHGRRQRRREAAGTLGIQLLNVFGYKTVLWKRVYNVLMVHFRRRFHNIGYNETTGHI